ncbi:MAG: hypothetical protein M0041_06495 [Nitrospiraceae bacterium]|jgi:hypothetical protein|nr:hypothetical protein [Nitrospiraceae bacterium]
MKKTYVPVRMPDDILVRVKKMAGDQGRSVSETVGILVLKSLESGPVSGPEMDLELLKKAIGEERDEHEETHRELAKMGLLPDPPNGSGLSPEVVRYLVETLARIEYFFEETTKASPKGEGLLLNRNVKAKEALENKLKELHIEKRV